MSLYYFLHVTCTSTTAKAISNPVAMLGSVIFVCKKAQGFPIFEKLRLIKEGKNNIHFFRNNVA